MKPNLAHALLLMLLVAIAGVLGNAMYGHLEILAINNDRYNKFTTRFEVMFIVAVLIERSVETYLNITQQNGGVQPVGTNPAPPNPPANKTALVAALVISMLVALCGLRLIETLVAVKPDASLVPRMVWHGVDIVVSAGLMAGGAELFHQLTTVLTTGLQRIRVSFKAPAPAGEEGGADKPRHFADERSSIRPMDILIEYPADPSKGIGTLRFQDGGAQIVARCRWVGKSRLAAGTYRECSKTTLPRTLSPAIYIPSGSGQAGEKDIYLVAEGDIGNPPDSIAVASPEFHLLWKCLAPENAYNITVTVREIA